MLALVFCGMASWAGATDSGEVTRDMTPEQAGSPATVMRVQESFVVASKGFITPETSRTLVYESSGGTFLPAVANLSQQAKLSVNSSNAALQRTARNMDLVFHSAASNNSGPARLSGEQTQNALAVMNGVAASGGAGEADSFNFASGGSGGTISTHLAELRNEPAVASGTAAASLNWLSCSRGTANRIWASPFYIRQDMDRNGGYQGYTYRAGGMSLGYDRKITHNTALGAAFTFAHGDYHRKGASDDNKIRTYGASAYWQYYSQWGVFANVAGGYTHGRNQWKEYLGERLGTQEGRNHTDSYWFGGLFGYDFRITCKLTLTPAAGLFWSASRGSEYASGGVFDMRVGRMKSDSLLLPVDAALRYEHRLGSHAGVTVKAGGGYSYNFRNDGARGEISYDYVGGSAVAVNGMAPGRHGWNVVAGVKYRYKNLDVGVDYRYDGKSKFNAHRVAATIGVNF